MIIVSHQTARLIIFPQVAIHGERIEVFPFFNLVEVWNSGISFGMLRELAYGQWVLSGVSLVITVIFLILLWREQKYVSAAAYSLIIGVAIGNVLDRIRFGAVADYLDFHLYDYHWPAFNLTDVAIVSGICLLIAQQLTTKIAYENEENDERKMT